MILIHYLQQEQAWFIGSSLLLGLLIGSFLNVVIHRLPQMMQRQWTDQAREYLGLEQEPTARLTLAYPGSHCPGCQVPIRAWQNIPLLSFLWLRGRCPHCHEAISWRYPAVELLTGIASAVVAWHFGWSWQTPCALLLTWSLIALSGIDLEHLLLPDSIVLPLMWLGLLLAIPELFTTLTDSVVGAAAGYLALWSIYQLFRLTTGKEGMGYGDFKLLALLGAWFGWQALPAIVLISSAIGAVVGLILIAVRRHQRATPLPFGPFLALAGWTWLVAGNWLAPRWAQLFSPY